MPETTGQIIIDLLQSLAVLAVAIGVIVNSIKIQKVLRASVPEVVEWLQAQGAEVVDPILDADADGWWVPVAGELSPSDDDFQHPGRYLVFRLPGAPTNPH